MKHIIYTGGLLLLFLILGCGSKKPTTMSNDPVMISGNIMVLMAKKAKPEVLETAFSEYNFENKGPASRSQNKYKFSFNAAGISAEAMTAKVEAHELVINAVIVDPIKQ